MDYFILLNKVYFLVNLKSCRGAAETHRDLLERFYNLLLGSNNNFFFKDETHKTYNKHNGYGYCYRYVSTLPLIQLLLKQSILQIQHD